MSPPVEVPIALRDECNVLLAGNIKAPLVTRFGFEQHLPEFFGPQLHADAVHSNFVELDVVKHPRQIKGRDHDTLAQRLLTLLLAVELDDNLYSNRLNL